MVYMEENRFSDKPLHSAKGGVDMGNTILFVDDEAVILKALQAVFSREGFQTLTALSGEDAIKILSREDVDVVVSDERMPGISGIELLSMVKEKYPDKIRIVLTAYAELNTILSAINQVEAHRLIIKPYKNEDFVQTVRTLLERKKTCQEKENALKRAEREAAFAFQSAKIMCNRQLSEHEKYTQIVDILKNYIRASTLSLMLLNPERNEIVVKAATNKKIVGLRRPLSDHSISSWVAREGRAYLCNGTVDQDQPSAFVPHDQTLTRYQTKAFLCIPVKDDTRTVGVFNVTDHEEGTISSSTEKTVSHLMRWVGAMIQTASSSGSG